MTELTVANDYGQERLEAWKTMYCNGTTNAEAEMFVRTAMACKLSPEKRQIFLVPRWNKDLHRNTYSPQVSIDGLRLIAQRTGVYGGQTPAEWCGSDGVWVTVWLKDEYPLAARVGVYRKDWQFPLYAIAKWNSYRQTNSKGQITAMWNKMPDLMLAKCAEALALRRAFPDETNGLYTEDEMAQATVVEVERSAAEAPKAIEIKIFDKDNEDLCSKLAKWTTEQESPEYYQTMKERMHGKEVLGQVLRDELAKAKIEAEHGEIEEVEVQIPELP